MRDASEELSFEVLKSERKLARVLLGVLALLFVLLVVMWFVPPESNPVLRITRGRFPFREAAMVMGAALLYEAGVAEFLGRAVAARRRVPALLKAGNGVIEASFASVLLMLLAHALGGETALNSPAMLLYFPLIGLSTLRLSAILSALAGVVAGAEYLALAFLYLRAGGATPTLFNSIPAMAARSLVMIMAGAICGFVALQIRQRLEEMLAAAEERHRVTSMFGQYVSADVMRHLLSAHVAGETRLVTVMFLDIRNFTSYAERRTPAEVVSYLNTLFAELIAVVNANHGMINKFLGDGFMACFGAPVSVGNDARNAVKAALEIADVVQRLNTDGAIAPTRVGIGLHTGPAVTGSIGSEERKEYTIIGDTVNVASRVEELTKQYGRVVLVTDSVWQAIAGEYEGTCLEPAFVKGRGEPVGVYALA